MAKLELPKFAQAKANVDGDLLAVLKELDPSDSTCFVKEMTATNVMQFDAEGNVVHGIRCQLVRC